MNSPCGNPISVYNIERTLCDIVRGNGSDIQIIGAIISKAYSVKKE